MKGDATLEGLWCGYILPGEGNGNPLQYLCLENSVDGEAWWATVYGVAKIIIHHTLLTENVSV